MRDGTAKPIELWSASGDRTEPMHATCESFTYLQTCTTDDGNTEVMYENTHFLRKEDAWRRVNREASAHVELAGRRVKDAKARLAEAEKEAGWAAEKWATIMANRENPKKLD